MEELQYYAISSDYCSACLNTSTVVPLLPNNAKVFFQSIEVQVLTPWLCNQCSDILESYQKLGEHSYPEVLLPYEEMKIRAGRAQNLLSDILLNSQVVQTKIDHYITELNEIRRIEVKETKAESSSGLKKPRSKGLPKISYGATSVVFDENDNMFARLSNIIRKKVIKIMISEREYILWAKEQQETEPYLSSKFKCEKCAVGFCNEPEFDEHMKSHCEDAGPLCCPLCEQYFESYHSLGEHMNGHLSHYSCVVCHLRKKQRSDVVDHYFSEHTKFKFICKYCDVVTRTPSALKEHLETVHQNDCHDCRQTFPNKSDLEKHMFEEHAKVASVQCPVCYKTFASKLRRRKHYTRVHGHKQPKNKICDVCGKGFATNRDLDRHRLIHTGEKPYQCEMCGRKFRQKGIMDVHVKIIHMGIKYRQLVVERRKKFEKLINK